MSGPIQKALDEIKMRIPREILDEVFVRQDNYYRLLSQSIDDAILTRVLRARVLVDCNLVGGTEVLIPLYKLSPIMVDDGALVYRIPKEMTQNRSINSVLSISYGNAISSAHTNPYGSSWHTPGVLGTGLQVMNAMSALPIVSSDKVQLIADNVVLFTDPNFTNSDLVLRAIVANDENMSHIQLRSYLHFSALCVLAVKAYIYNTLIIRMDMGILVGGQALGKFKDLVDNYADSDELYMTYLREKWTKVALMNDKESWSRLKKLMIGANN